MKKTVALIDRALKSLYNLQTPLRAEDFLLTAPISPSHKSRPGMLFVEPPTAKDESLGLGIYLGPEIQKNLTELPETPWNVQLLAAFGVAAEEVSHFHYIAHFAPQGRGVSQLELEFQGEIDRFLLTFFAVLPQDAEGEKTFESLMEKCFEGFSWFEGLSTEVQARYEEANRLAKAFLIRHAELLSQVGAREKFLKVVRDFYRLSFEEKVNRAIR